MRILAFDCSTPATAVALLPERLEVRDHPQPGERPGHAPMLLPLAAQLLDEAGATFADVERIAVGTGPGTFTGLRIAVATARALAQGTGAELVGVSSLQALAVNAFADQTVLAVLDARRGEAFVGGWRGGGQVVPTAAVTPAVLANIGRPGWLAVGDGAVRFRDVLEPPGAHVPADGSPLHRVSALALAGLAASAPETAIASVVPAYLRLPDAEIAFLKRAAQP